MNASYQPNGDIPTAVTAVKAGAMEFLTKPFDDEHLLEAVRSAVARANKRATAIWRRWSIGASWPTRFGPPKKPSKK
jgi:FixJ family two-component response regulator